MYENNYCDYHFSNGSYNRTPLSKELDTLFKGGPVIFCLADDVEYKGMVFPKRGVYFNFSKEYSMYVTRCELGDFPIPETPWDGNIETIKTIDPKYIPSELNEIVLPSSTSGSSKKFKITVDDSGAITATEV